MIWLLTELRDNFYIYLNNMALHPSVEVPRSVIFILLDPQTSKFCPSIPNYVTYKQKNSTSWKIWLCVGSRRITLKPTHTEMGLCSVK